MGKPEDRFITSVHDQLLSESKFHREKMWNALRGGTADVWYSGDKADLWIEYKWTDLPRRAETRVKADLSAQQTHWLESRYDEGRSVAVILGFNIGKWKHGVVFLNRTWKESWSASFCYTRACNSKELALWIQSRCLRGSYLHLVKPIGT